MFYKETLLYDSKQLYPPIPQGKIILAPLISIQSFLVMVVKYSSGIKIGWERYKRN